jgi:CBS domain-containing protein
MTTVQQIMHRNPITCSADACMNDVARLMWEHDVGMLPVVDGNGRIVGAITDRDVAMAAYTQGRPLSAISVRSAMSNPVQTAKPNTALAELERIMAENQIRRVPVVDDGGRVIGIVGMGDLAEHASIERGRAVSLADIARTARAVTRPRRGASEAAAE